MNPVGICFGREKKRNSTDYFANLLSDPAKTIKQGSLNSFLQPKQPLVGGWTNPSEKYARQTGSFPRDEKKTYLKPPPRPCVFLQSFDSHLILQRVKRTTSKSHSASLINHKPERKNLEFETQVSDFSESKNRISHFRFLGFYVFSASTYPVHIRSQRSPSGRPSEFTFSVVGGWTHPTHFGSWNPRDPS